MKSSKCVKCNHSFSYKEKLYACLNGNHISCKICGTQYKIAFFSKLILCLLLMLLIYLERFIGKYYDVPLMAFILSYLAILIFLYPLWLRFRLKSKQNRLEMNSKYL